MADDQGFSYDNLRKLTKRLPPSVLARYETVSGVVVLNMPKKSYMASVQRYGTGTSEERDLHLIRVLNHESSHFVQCLSSGYMGWRTRHLWRALNDKRNATTVVRMKWLEVRSTFTLLVFKLFAGRTNASKLRVRRMVTAMHVINRLALVNKIIGNRRRSLARLDFPFFFKRLDVPKTDTHF